MLTISRTHLDKRVRITYFSGMFDRLKDEQDPVTTWMDVTDDFVDDLDSRGPVTPRTLLGATKDTLLPGIGKTARAAAIFPAVAGATLIDSIDSAIDSDPPIESGGPGLMDRIGDIRDRVTAGTPHLLGKVASLSGGSLFHHGQHGSRSVPEADRAPVSLSAEPAQEQQVSDGEHQRRL